MYISEILKDMKLDIKYEIVNDLEFETLGLTASVIEKTLCIFLDNERFLDDLPNNANMIITNQDLANKIKNRGICIAENPRTLFFQIHNFLKNNKNYCRSVFKTKIDKDCNISKLSSIAENNVKIGENVTIEEFVIIRENTTIGDNVIIRAGTIIGGTDFEFKRTNSGILSVEHLGGVIIGNNVEIQQNSSICRAIYPWDNTVIGDNSKIDDLVQISHGAKIGNGVFIVALSGIGGRTVIGDDTWIGYSTTISNGLTIGKYARVNIGSVVTKNVGEGESVSGNFAINHGAFIKHIKKLSEEKVE